MTDLITKEYGHANDVETGELVCKSRASIFQLKSLLIKSVVYTTAMHLCLFWIRITTYIEKHGISSLGSSRYSVKVRFMLYLQLYICYQIIIFSIIF